MLINEFPYKLLGRFLDFLWHQWSTLGVAGQPGGNDDRLIDPEALLLVTTRFGRYDSRLLDEVIEWLNSNGKRINLQRLRRLNKEWPVADQRVLAAISGVLAKQATMRKWKVLSKPLPAEVKPELLFVNYDGSALPVLHKPETGSPLIISARMPFPCTLKTSNNNSASERSIQGGRTSRSSKG